jgi:DNA polymerase I-like protein with 3'-5' exonuclease and polymerase domains
MTISLFPQLKTEWMAPEVFPDLSSAEAIAIDLETCDPGMKTSGPGWPTKNGYIVGFALAVDGWKGYFPTRHGGGGNLDEKKVRKFVQTVLDLPCDKIFFNAAYDVGWLKAEGFTINGRIIDAMIAAALIDENRFSYSLNALGFDYLQETKSEQGLRDAAKEFGVDPKGELYKLPALYVGEYAEQDAALTLKLWQFFKIEMIRQELTSIFELEMELCPHLIEMTFRGVRIDQDRAEKTKKLFQAREKEALAQIKSLSGVQIDIWAAASIAKAFDKLGIKYPKTEKGAPSFTKSFLTYNLHPITRAIVDAREYNKANGTFIDALLNYARYDGRIHGHINQLRSDDGGTVSGRLSMANPNLQQIPARHLEIGPAIRSLFLPEQDEIWASLDFSQQEPRLAVHYAKLLELKGADKAVEAYITNPDTDFHQTVADMAGIGRKQAKTIGLGLLYGMGKGKMATELDLSTEEASELIGKFHELVPFMKGLVTAVQQRVDHPASNGSVRTLLGRRCRFNLWEPTEFGLHKALPREQAVLEYGPRLKRAYTYKGLNRLIQGSAADQTKKSMLACIEAGKLPLLQVHDELCLSVTSAEEANKFAQAMMDCVKLEVPSKVDVECGPSWGEAA